MMRRVGAWAIAALIGLGAGAASAQEEPQVITVNHALAYLAEQLLDGEAQVVFPVPADTDPSFWRPSISDISTIQAADLIVLNGAGFATWIDRVSLPRSRVVNTSTAIEDQFIVTESITHSHGDGGEHSHEGVASYLWLDPSLASAQAQAIADALVARGLADERDIAERLTALQSDLTELEDTTRAALGGAQDTVMIATHPRYQYFARAYDLSITPLEWEAGEMPSDAQLAELQALTEELDARILIWEAQPPQAAIEAADHMGLTSVVFEPLAREAASGSFTQTYTQAAAEIAAALGDSTN